MVNEVIKWKKLSTVLLVSSMIMPLVPHQVFAEEEVENNSSVISEQKEPELNDSLYTNINESDIYKIDQVSQDVLKVGSFDFVDQMYFIEDEVNISSQKFVFVSNETKEIGWFELSSLEEIEINLIDNRSESDLNDSLNIHNMQDNNSEDEVSSVTVKEESEMTSDSDSDLESTGTESEVGIKENSENTSLEETKVIEDEVESKLTQRSSLMTTSSSSNILEVLSTKEVSYAADITKPWSINTLPWGTKGANLVDSAANYIGKTVVVSQEKVTPRSTYALISYKDQEIGWIDVTGIKKYTITDTKSVDYTVEVTKPWSVNTHPWGTSGFTPSNVKSVIGNEYLVKKEAVTQRSTYVLLTKDGNNIGWIDSTGVQKRLRVLSETSVNYAAEVVEPWSVNTRPWGTAGSQKVAADGSFVGKNVTVSNEIKTPRATYAAISIGDKQLGWVDKTALDILTVTNHTNVDYSVVITKPWSINTLPWGVEGYSTVETYAQRGTGYSVIKEAKTARSTYVLLEKNSKEIGWIDITGVEKATEIKSSKNITYVAKVIHPWSVNTNPYGTAGAKRVMSAKEIIGENVTISEEKVTETDTYAYISSGNKELGWINKTGLAPIVISHEKTVDYNVSVIKPWSVNTRPWGTEGYKKVLDGSSIIGNKYRVNKEATTSRGTYAFLVDMNNKEIGWIDKDALDSSRVIMIDPGHGGVDPGAHGILNGRRINEKDLNLTVSLKLRKILESQGYKVLMTRDDDSTVQALDRGRITNSSNADVFLSIHFNALPKTMTNYSSVHGIETFFYEYNEKYPSKLLPDTHDNPYKLAEGFKLAEDIQNGLISETGAKYRRLDNAAFIVIKEVEIPAALTELGFLTNQQDLAKAVTDSYQNKLAQGLANGVNNYFNR